MPRLWTFDQAAAEIRVPKAALRRPFVSLLIFSIEETINS